MYNAAGNVKISLFLDLQDFVLLKMSVSHLEGRLGADFEKKGRNNLLFEENYARLCLYSDRIRNIFLVI